MKVVHCTNRWEKEVKNVMTEVAEHTLGVKKYKVGKTRLKGWWDKEVERGMMGQTCKEKSFK